MTDSADPAPFPARGEIHAAAIDYIRRGWSVLPLIPKNKEPLGAWKNFTYFRATETQVDKWFKNNPGANLGIIAGDVSGGLVVIDIDTDGGEIPPELEPWRSSLTLTSCVSTGKGSHFYFSDGENLQTKVHTWGEARAGGVYVVAPPSIHPSGAVYRWKRGPKHLKPLPDGMRELFKEGNEIRRTTKIRGVHQMGGAFKNYLSSMQTNPALNEAQPFYKVTTKIKSKPHNVQAARSRTEMMELMKNPAAVEMVMTPILKNRVKVGIPFLCPFHHEQNPSAVLQPMKDGTIAFVDYHNAPPQPQMIPDTYRTITSGKKFKHLNPGERILWWARALKSVGLLDTPTRLATPFQELPDKASMNAKKVYQGFKEVLEFRALYDSGEENTMTAPGGAPFLAAWCGLKNVSSVQAGIKWLRENNYLIMEKAGNRRQATIYSLGKGINYAKSETRTTNQAEHIQSVG